MAAEEKKKKKEEKKRKAKQSRALQFRPTVSFDTLQFDEL